MEFKPETRLTRREGLIGLAAALAAGSGARAAGSAPVVTILGDSITAGLGLPAADALPAQLSAALARIGSPAQVRGAAVSGDTTADALARVDFSVQGDTRLCLVALGGNDLLQGVEPRAVAANLTAIVRRLKARRIAVVLAGMRAPAGIGSAYAREFNAIYAQVAKAEAVRFYPFLLEGVAADPRLNQADSIHPNAAGVKIIAWKLAPVLARALKAGR
ncbi:arylesterase [Phenylobacterium montanum]|uniref:Arylesterase n=1 Tax=Phenylobacterium montanum TaxID=2823693 RepID=A0A975FW73_9CAUL|nr:arylesterase [Caulobacter sp. S6]QUD86404.1 arylesterase [Caulobacter sp. S6]